MYNSFFELQENPFALNPNPKFFFWDKVHSDAMKYLMFGIKNQEGFIEILGDAGTGKSSLCLMLLEQLDPKINRVLFSNPPVYEHEFLQTLAERLKLDPKKKSRQGLIDAITEFAKEEAACENGVVIILDEAQHLSVDMLEKIRLLTNIANIKRPIQIILIGQPELEEKLRSHQLRQLYQRITIRFKLRPLTRKEMCQYIEFRLEQAKPTQPITFSGPARKMIFRFSQGYPRLINVVCEKALLAASLAQTSCITPRLIKAALKSALAIDKPFGTFNSASGGLRFAFASFVLIFILLGGAFWELRDNGKAGVKFAGIQETQHNIDRNYQRENDLHFRKNTGFPLTTPSRTAAGHLPVTAREKKSAAGLGAEIDRTKPLQRKTVAGREQTTAVPEKKPEADNEMLTLEIFETVVAECQIPEIYQEEAVETYEIPEEEQETEKAVNVSASSGHTTPPVSSLVVSYEEKQRDEEISLTARALPQEVPATLPNSGNAAQTAKNTPIPAEAGLMKIEKNWKTPNLVSLVTLLNRWGVRNIDEVKLNRWRNISPQNFSFRDVVGELGLYASYLRTDLKELRFLSMPAILLGVYDNVREKKYTMALTGLSKDRAEILNPGQGEIIFTTEELSANWGGEAVVLWRNIDKLPPRMLTSPQDNGILRKVWRRLETQGYAFGELPVDPNDPDVTCSYLEEAVIAFQKKNGLIPDGIIGTRTRLKLYAGQGEDSSPDLSDFTEKTAVKSKEDSSETGALKISDLRWKTAEYVKEN